MNDNEVKRPGLANQLAGTIHLAATVLLFLFIFAGLSGEGALMIAAVFWLLYAPSYALLAVCGIAALLKSRPLTIAAKIGLSTPLFLLLVIGLQMLGNR